MADIKKKGLKTIETNYEELEERIWNHRKAVVKRVLQVLVVVAVAKRSVTNIS